MLWGKIANLVYNITFKKQLNNNRFNLNLFAILTQFMKCIPIQF